jgi:hypothetical protein
MKYLRPFNESLSFKDELLDFCESNLAYLLDEDTIIIVRKENFGKKHSTLVRIIFCNSTATVPKSWDEIKDHMIPFLIRLNSKYDIYKFFGEGEIKAFVNYDNKLLAPSTYLTQEVYCKLKNLIKDKTEFDDCKLTGLLFYVDKYKQPKKSFISKIKSFFK